MLEIPPAGKEGITVSVVCKVKSDLPAGLCCVAPSRLYLAVLTACGIYLPNLFKVSVNLSPFDPQ